MKIRNNNETQQSVTTRERNGAFIQKRNTDNALNDFHGLRTWRPWDRIETTINLKYLILAVSCVTYGGL
jgi:hypothetical protein